MTGDDFISLASQFVNSPNPSEALLRTVIGRAYYGAFHLARAFLADLGVKHGKDHGQIWKLLGSSGVNVAKQVATKLAVLHENRTMADYDLNSVKPKSGGFAKDNLDRAKDVQSLLLTCHQEPVRSQIKSGIMNRKSPKP